MRLQGTLITWHDDRGFGFIEPTQGGQQIFVHIKAFPPGSRRPTVGQALSFEVTQTADGKKRAKAVQYPARPSAKAHPQRFDAPARWTLPRLLALPVLLVLMGVLAAVWGFEALVPALYGVVSLLTFFAYALDKSAAKAGAWRTPEKTLHLLALAGGWPGALLAQQLLRHKTAKPSFIGMFWLTVALNLCGLAAWQSGLLHFTH